MRFIISLFDSIRRFFVGIRYSPGVMDYHRDALGNPTGLHARENHHYNIMGHDDLF